MSLPPLPLPPIPHPISCSVFVVQRNTAISGFGFSGLNIFCLKSNAGTVWMLLIKTISGCVFITVCTVIQPCVVHLHSVIFCDSVTYNASSFLHRPVRSRRMANTCGASPPRFPSQRGSWRAASLRRWPTGSTWMGFRSCVTWRPSVMRITAW